jgi:ornithine cyclodeaminase/alanine dehydrogenase-like protein (mu-crystallin family)
LQKGKELLYLCRADVERVGLTMDEIIAVLEEAFREKGHGRYEMPPKPGLHPRPDSFIHAMPCFIPGLAAAGIKWVSGFADNQQKYGLPYISGLFILNCPETGLPLAVMDCVWLTAMRTGAVSGLTAKYLARPDAAVLGVLGCGVQGRSNLAALVVACPTLRQVYCYDIKPEALQWYVAEMSQAFPQLTITPVPSAREAVVDSDIVVTAGPILKHPRPTIEAEWFKVGALALPVDYDSYWQSAALQLADRFYTDDMDQFIYHKQLGFFAGTPTVTGDLGDVVTGKVPARRDEQERLVAMNLGIGLDDVATARILYDRALAKGIGQVLPL